jgi:hypothetical protein
MKHDISALPIIRRSMLPDASVTKRMSAVWLRQYANPGGRTAASATQDAWQTVTEGK